MICTLFISLFNHFESFNFSSQNIRCYGVYCKTGYSGTDDKNFFNSLSEQGKGSFLELENFDSVFDFMMAICYREQGEDALFVSFRT